MTSQFTICGSYSEHPANSAPAESAAAGYATSSITLVLRRRNEAPDPTTLESHLLHAEHAEAYGADPADVEAVEKFAQDHQLSVEFVNIGARSVRLAGSSTHLASLFGADVQMRNVGGQIIQTRRGHLHVPAPLAGRVTALLGFDERPVANTYHRRDGNAEQNTAYTPAQVAAAYNFPLNKGEGQTIALIELGGGFKKADLQKYWKLLGISSVATAAVSVDGAKNAPTGDANGPDGEVVLDIEVAGGVAPGAKIVVYFAPNTDQGFLNAINAAIHDKARRPTVISISWGSPEGRWTGQALSAFDAAFHDAALLGITVCAAAGDNGSSDGESDGAPHVDFPASSPWVLACGGTRLVIENGRIQSETVWNDGTGGGATGGGVSSHFPAPSYQAGLSIPVLPGTNKFSGRGVPDVSGVADPETGFVVLVDGKQDVVGGTSAVAPLWAGLVALLNEQLGKNLGWFHPTLYGAIAQHKVLHDVTSGTNGDFKSSIGWDACTGLGSPDGAAILKLLKS